jgi:hypothetical protein
MKQSLAREPKLHTAAKRSTSVGSVDGVTLISVPQGDANVGMKPE